MVTDPAAGVLRGFIGSRSVSRSDSNRSRWPPATWWVQFLQTAQKITISRAAPEFATVQVSLGWIIRQCLPALALVNDAYFDDSDLWQRLFEQGRARYSQHHTAALEGDYLWAKIQRRETAPATVAAWAWCGIEAPYFGVAGRCPSSHPQRTSFLAKGLCVVFLRVSGAALGLFGLLRGCYQVWLVRLRTLLMRRSC